jgi:hypothetical protein
MSLSTHGDFPRLNAVVSYLASILCVWVDCDWHAEVGYNVLGEPNAKGEKLALGLNLPPPLLDQPV